MALEIGKQRAHRGTQLKTSPGLCPEPIHCSWALSSRGWNTAVSSFCILGGKAVLMFVVLTESNGTDQIWEELPLCYMELRTEPGSGPGWTAVCGHDLHSLPPLLNYGSEKLALRTTPQLTVGEQNKTGFLHSLATDQNTVSFPTIETTAGVASLPRERQSCSHDSLLKKKKKTNSTERGSEPNTLDSELHLLPTHRKIGQTSYTQQTSTEKRWC